MSAETATRASRAMRSSPALVDDAALEDTPFSETEDAMRFRASRAELRVLREARAREDDAIVAKAERGEPLTAEEIVLRARARRDAALRLQRQLDDAVAAAKSTLARWDARGFHRDARFGDAVLAHLRRNLQTTKAEVARRVAEELPAILAARRQRQRDHADRRAAEAAERERRDDERRDAERRAEGTEGPVPERPVPDDAARRSSPPPRSSAEALERVLADEPKRRHGSSPPPPTLPPETNEERRERDRERERERERWRLADDDVRDPDSDASSDFFDDTGDASADVEAERAAWNAELERRRAALAAERAALEAPTRSSASERSARFAALAALTSRVFERRGDGNLYETETRDGIGVDATRSESNADASAGEACAAVVALIRSVAPGDGEPVPESFASGAFMAVTTRTDARLSESEVAAAEAELRDAQDPDGARLFGELLAHFKSLAACRAMEPRRAARALADATVPTGNSDAARRALVDRFAQLLRALIPDDAERDDSERRPAEGSRRRSVPLGGVLGDALGAPNVPPVPSAAVSGGSSTLLVGGARIARGRPGSGGRGLNLSGSAAFAAPAPADLDESDELEAQLRGLPSPTAARAAAEERRRAAAGSNAVESSAEPRNDLRDLRGTGSGAGGGAGAGPGPGPGPGPAADALDESSFSADDSTVSDAPAAAAGTTNARVGSAPATARSSATGRGTGKGPAIAGPTNVGSILTRAMQDESDTDASSSDRSRLLGGGGGGGGDDDESDSFDF